MLFCDEKLSPAHKCANKQFMWLDSDELCEDVAGEVSPKPSESSGEELPSIHHLSLHLFQGQQGKATIRFSGSI